MTDTQLTPTTFHEALYLERERMGLTQAELAERLTTSQQNIASWESGRSTPRTRNLARVLEFFGPDSTVSKLAPQGKTPPGPNVRVTLFDESGASVDRDLREVWREATEASNSHSSRQPPDLRKALPQRFHPFIDRPMQLGSRIVRPDYWSPSLGMEVIWIRGATPPLWVLHRARMAMQQLLVWNRAHPAETPRKLALVVVAEDAASILQGSVLERLSIESSLLSIGVVFTSSVDGVQHVIEEIESGRPIMEDE